MLDLFQKSACSCPLSVEEQGFSGGFQGRHGRYPQRNVGVDEWSAIWLWRGRAGVAEAGLRASLVDRAALAALRRHRRDFPKFRRA